MKPCDKVMLYAGEEMTEREEANFRRHLRECARCRAEVKFLEAERAALQAPSAPAAVVDALFAKTTRRPQTWRVIYKPLWAGTLLLLLGVGLIGGGLFLERGPGYDSREIMAYMTYNLDEEYQTFASDLAQMEEEF